MLSLSCLADSLTSSGAADDNAASCGSTASGDRILGEEVPTLYTVWTLAVDLSE